MFLAPFGMLISKWVAMKAFIDSKNILTVIILGYGSATTLFYWTKWMGKLVANANRKDHIKHTFHIDEEIPIFIHAVLVVLSCFTFLWYPDMYLYRIFQVCLVRMCQFLSEQVM